MNCPISTYSQTTSNSALNGAEILVDFNAKEKDYESGCHYYGARYYDSEVLTGWLSVDPMADKYPSISPYAYCVWNPVKLVDSDGRLILPAKGSTVEFKEQLNKTLFYLNTKECGEISNALQVSPIITYVQEQTSISSTIAPASTNDLTSTIHWDPYGGIITSNGTILSPASVLNHEFDHRLQGVTNSEQKKADKKIWDPMYGNNEEKRVITGSEQSTALSLGEITPLQVTRTDHSGKMVETIDPCSNITTIPRALLSPAPKINTNLQEVTINGDKIK